MKAAQLRGFPVIGLDIANQCSSSTEAFERYQMHGASEECSNPTEGSLVNNVYSIAQGNVENIGSNHILLMF